MKENLKKLMKEWEVWSSPNQTTPNRIIEKEKRSIATAVRHICKEHNSLTDEEKRFIKETECFLERTS